MIVVIQRTRFAKVEVAGEVIGEIGKGYLILLGIEEADGKEDIEWLSRKIVQMRLWEDENGVMNRSILEAGGDILVVSQFTLHASTKKGNRPSYIKAAKPDTAIPLYEAFKTTLSQDLGKGIASGSFGAMMEVSLCNDGPVTIIMDSKDKK
jgi:D-tyrosyl-tRNA(Tyr) deacylase